MVIYPNIKLNLVIIFPGLYDLKQIIKATKLNDNSIAYIFLLLYLSKRWLIARGIKHMLTVHRDQEVKSMPKLRDANETSQRHRLALFLSLSS